MTPHFTFAEFTKTEVRHLQALNTERAKGYMAPLLALATLLERVRGIWGRPLVVHSAFRCRELNDHIGGSKTSQHLLGEAADFHIPGVDLTAVFDRLRTPPSPIGGMFGQLILEDGDGDGVPTWIHLSLGHPYRPSAKCGQVFRFNGKTYLPA